jgi:hypothetical protein
VISSDGGKGRCETPGHQVSRYCQRPLDSSYILAFTIPGAESTIWLQNLVNKKPQYHYWGKDMPTVLEALNFVFLADKNKTDGGRYYYYEQTSQEAVHKIG